MKRWQALSLSLVALGVWFAWRSEFNHDEIEHLHASWLMSIGQLPYRDFLEQHHPPLWILFEPLVSQLRSPRLLVFAARLYDLALIACFAWTLHRLVKRLHPQAAPWAVLLVLGSYIFSHNMLLFRPDPTMNTIFYAGLLQWTIFLQEGKVARAAAAGLLFGLAAAVLQKAFAMCGLLALATVLLLVLHRRDAARRRSLLLGAGAALGSALLPLAALAGWALAHGIWRDFWFWNYRFNRFFYTAATLSMHFSVAPRFLRSLVEDPALWIFGAVGVWHWVRRLRAWGAGDDLRLTLLVMLLGYMILLSFNKFPFEQYFIVFLPLWAPFVAELQPTRLLRLAAVAMLLVSLGQFFDLADSSGQRRVQDYLLAHTAPDEPIYASPPHHPIFRKDASYFWYNGAVIGDACAQYQKLHPGAIGLHPFDPRARFVYLDPDFPTSHPWGWPKQLYHPSGEPDIWTR